MTLKAELKTSMKGSAKKAKKAKQELKCEEKPKLPITLDCSPEYNLNQANVAPFVDALLKIHKTKLEDTEKDEKKSQLFGAEETPIKLQISGIKIPREDRKHLIKA